MATSSSELARKDSRRREIFRPDVPRSGVSEFLECCYETEPTADGEPLISSIASAVSARPPFSEELLAEVRSQLEAQTSAQMGELEARFAENLQSLRQELVAAQERALGALSEAAARLALKVGERLARAHIEQDPEAVALILNEALSELEGGRRIRLRLHPEDLTVLSGQNEALKAMHVEELIADPTLSRGGCLVDIDDRGFDLSIESQVEKIGEQLRELMEPGA